MKFRATYLTDQPLERPIQTFGNSLSELSDWAKTILDQRENGKVEIYLQLEELVVTVTEGKNWKGKREKKEETEKVGDKGRE